jgi:hypothetical protein
VREQRHRADQRDRGVTLGKRGENTDGVGEPVLAAGGQGEQPGIVHGLDSLGGEVAGPIVLLRMRGQDDGDVQ